MKEIISILVTFVMVFNLTSEVFAQTVPFKSSSTGVNLPQSDQYRNGTAALVLATEEQIKEQERASVIGLNPTEYRKAMEQYAKANKIDINNIDIAASYRTYVKSITKYDSDYHALVKIFAKKTYFDVLNDANYYLGKKEDFINYDGKKYSKVALFHAAIHNLATRTKTGYLNGGKLSLTPNQESDFDIKEKVAVMDFIYKVISNDGYYPKDEEALYKMASDVVSNGKPYFTSTKQHKDEIHNAKGVVAAISILTVLSNTSARKQESAQTIYNLSKSVMRKELGAMGILSGSQALLVLNTDDSLNKLYTLLAEDLYRGIGTELGLYLVETFSIEELQQRLAGFASEVNNGLGQYYNAIARRYVYVDPDKNSYDQKRLAEARDESLANYSNVIYTDIFEQIGKEIGRRTKDLKVAKLASRFATKYYTELNAAKQGTANTIIGQRADSPLKRETKIHASLIVGILSTAKVTSENLTKAAKVIYNGSWWDINEITQRDKNNIAASYLKLAKKPFNKRKQDMYALTIRTKNVAKFLDVYAQALMIGKMIVSMPAMISKVGNWFSRIRNFKIEMKPTNPTKAVSTVKPVEVKPTEVRKPAELKPAEVKPAEVKPAEPKPAEIRPAEVVPSEMPRPVEVAEPAQAVQTPKPLEGQVAPQTAEADVWISESSVANGAKTEQIIQIGKQVKYDILSPFYQKPAAMLLGPFGLSKKMMAFLTGKPYLSDEKLAKVREIVSQASADVEGQNLSADEVEKAIKEKVFAKIQESDVFTAQEKLDLIGPTSTPKLKGISAEILFTKEYKNKLLTEEYEQVTFFYYDIEHVMTYLPSDFIENKAIYRGMTLEKYEDLKRIFVKGLELSRSAHDNIFFSRDIKVAIGYSINYNWGHLPVIIKKHRRYYSNVDPNYNDFGHIVRYFKSIPYKNIDDVLVWAQIDGKLGWWRVSLDENGEVILHPTDNMKNVK